MEFKINFQYENGEEDFFIISGDSIEEIRDKADIELEKRNGKNPWSEELQPSTSKRDRKGE